jgi:SpoVK/Ycf46/Vps4 family AAA+-type ATPase
MTPGLSFLSSSIPLGSGVNGALPRVRFGNNVETPNGEQKDVFVSSGKNESVAPEQPAETGKSPIGKKTVEDKEEITSKLSELDNDDEEDEPETDFVAKLVESAKPLEFSDATVPVIQQVRGNSAEQLRQILSRPHLNSAILKYDDERIKNGVLAQMQAAMMNPPLLSVDCEGIEPEKSGFFSSKKKECQLPQKLEEAIPRIEEKARLSGNRQQPLILLLENVHEDELSNLQSSRVYKKLQKQFPNVRFIIPAGSSNGNDSKPKWLNDDNETESGQWRAGQFQILQVPSLKPQEWAQVMKRDPFVQQMLNHWDLSADESVLSEFFHVLKKENPDTPLTYETLLAELDALGSFVNPIVDKEKFSLTSKHIKDYTRKVLATRRTHKPTSGGPAGMGPPPYDIINSGDINVRMDDIVGHDDAKKVLTQALRETKYPEFFEHLNQNDPDAGQSSVLLMGPPGGGKTMLAKALASQGGATFISTSGSRFVNGLVGGGANGIRRLRDAVEEAPDDLVVLFIDEMDALGSRTGMTGGEGGASGSEDLKTINEFLAFTDGVKKSSKHILLVGATNRPEALDPAILSRFNRKLEIREMDRAQRQILIEKQLEQKGLVPDEWVDIYSLSKRTKGFSGRDIKNMIKNVKDTLISRLDDAELEKLERDEDARKAFRLRPTHKDMIESIREIKRSKRQIDENGDTGAYSGGDKQNNGGRKLYAITA